nr:unnamed protein product [Callosobruchus analis]
MDPGKQQLSKNRGRSNSLGKLSIEKQEINRIIGIELVSKKQSKIDVNSERKNNISSRTNECYQQADREGTQSGSYAQIESSQHSSQAKQPVINEKQQWKTPPVNKKHETVVRIEKVEDPKIVLNRLKSEVQLKDTNRGFKNIRQLRSGAISHESHNKTQQSKLKEILKDKEGIKIKENEINDPMLVITGISKGYENEEFVNN